MLFGTMSGLGSRNSGLSEGAIPKGKGQLLGWNMPDKPFTFWWAPTISLERLQVELSRRSCQVPSTSVGGQCDKLATVRRPQFSFLSHWSSISVHNTVGVRHRVVRVCQRQGDLWKFLLLLDVQWCYTYDKDGNVTLTVVLHYVAKFEHSKLPPNILPRDAMLARYMLLSCTRLSVRLSQAGTVPKW